MTPDLWCFGKVIGGGLPVGAFGGSKEILLVARTARARLPGGDPLGKSLRDRGGCRRADHVTLDEWALLSGRVRNFASDLEAAIRDAGLFALTRTSVR